MTIWSAAAQAGAVSVQVEGVRNARGEIYVAICSVQAFNGERCEVAAKAPAGDAGKPIAFPGVPPGTYAVKVFHDENGNGRLDRDWFGSPTEGFALSNNPPRNSWKQFEAAAFTVADQPAKLTVRLSYR
jgi:uncharacterized protein (DUF2141 family)